MHDLYTVDESGKPTHQRKNSWQVRQNIPRLWASKQQQSVGPDFDVSVRIKQPWTCTTQTPPRPPLPTKPLPSPPSQNQQRKNSVKHLPPAKPLPSPPSPVPNQLNAPVTVSEGSVVAARAPCEELYYTKKYHRLSCSAPLVRIQRELKRNSCFRSEPEPITMSEDGKGASPKKSKKKSKKKSHRRETKEAKSKSTRHAKSMRRSERTNKNTIDTEVRSKSMRKSAPEKQRHRHSIALLLTPKRSKLPVQQNTASELFISGDESKGKGKIQESTSADVKETQRPKCRKAKSSSRRTSPETVKKRKKLSPESSNEDLMWVKMHSNGSAATASNTSDSEESTSCESGVPTPKVTATPARISRTISPDSSIIASSGVTQEQIWDCLDRNECTVRLGEGADILQRMYLCVTCQDNEQRQRDKLNNIMPPTPRDIFNVNGAESGSSLQQQQQQQLPPQQTAANEAELQQQQKHNTVCESCAGVCHVGHTFVVLGQVTGSCGCATSCATCTSTSPSSHESKKKTKSSQSHSQSLSDLSLLQQQMSRPTCRASA